MEEIVEQAVTGNFGDCVATLLRRMLEQFPALCEATNPVAENLAGWTRSNLEFLIQEYSAFSNAAIHMFLEARIRNHFPALTAEIERNMDEEMGILTKGIPHLELMRHGYRVELGIETEALETTAATRDFIDRMMRLFRNPDNRYLAGVLLAFEATAVDEFRVVGRMLRRHRELLGEQIGGFSLTSEYIAGHVAPAGGNGVEDPEMDHCRGMIEAVGSSIAQPSPAALRPVAKGFLAVCVELDRWWQLLAQEALLRDVRTCLWHDHADRDTYPWILGRLGQGLNATPQKLEKGYAPVA